MCSFTTITYFGSWSLCFCMNVSITEVHRKSNKNHQQQKHWGRKRTFNVLQQRCVFDSHLLFCFFFQSSKPKSQFHISECNMRTFQLHLYFKMNHKVSVTVVYTHSIYFCRVLMVYVFAHLPVHLMFFLSLFFHLSYICWQGMFVSCSIRLYYCRCYHCHRHYGFLSFS